MFSIKTNFFLKLFFCANVPGHVEGNKIQTRFESKIVPLCNIIPFKANTCTERVTYEEAEGSTAGIVPKKI